MRQNNSWALILGGSSGLGLATAEKLASSGFHICIVHRDRKANLPDFEAKCEAMRKHDVSIKTFNASALKPETIDTVIHELPEGKVSVLVHSIAKGSLKTLTENDSTALSLEDINLTLHAMATSWYEWAKALKQANRFAEDVRNIAFTSEGNQKVWPGYGAVSAAKVTLEALMRQMAVEWASQGIRTNCIQAGTAETPSFKMIPGSEQLAEAAAKRNPFNRLTTPEDVANAVWLLCQPEAKWINGTILKVDGGESLR
ncbi:SDR family oxidoreductase [Flavobacteriaceae bacterium TK19130]|nr:SDR family oxidoreductase [Thermobacterium salinum]